MAERVYEGMFLLDANKYARDAGVAASKVNDIIEKCGGKILVSRLWAEQKLAYPINGQRKGVYWLTYFRMDGGKMAELRRSARLSTLILRELTISIDPRLVDALVAHAAAGAGATKTVMGREQASGAEEDKNSADGSADAAKAVAAR